MSRPSLPRAAVGAVVALAVAAIVNAILALIAGDVLVIPGELGLVQIVSFTLGAAIPAAVTLWLLPRYYPWIAIAVALLTIPFPLSEFGSPAGWWLAVMHVVTGVCAAVIAPRIAARTSSPRVADAT